MRHLSLIGIVFSLAVTLVPSDAKAEGTVRVGLIQMDAQCYDKILTWSVQRS